MIESKEPRSIPISVIIPNYNGAKTIDKCLEAAFSSEYQNFEVIVVDDCSTDGSVEIIKRYPCKLTLIDRHSGASRARNIGAQKSSGRIFFLIDADCLLQKDTLTLVSKAYSEDGRTIIGGTYTSIPYDHNFFSTFQSIFINYSETKKKDNPDYIATHAFIIDSHIFKDAGGFREDFFLPILEDVEFSHRLRKAGYRLAIDPGILVQHIFNFSLFGSLLNAVRKSMYWTVYSIRNRDLLKDSGTASIELKTNVFSYFLSLLFLMTGLFSGESVFLIATPFIFGVNIYVNRRLIKAFYEKRGTLFTSLAIFYYTIIYPLGVGLGAFAGTLIYFWRFKIRGGQ